MAAIIVIVLNMILAILTIVGAVSGTLFAWVYLIELAIFVVAYAVIES